MTESLWLKHGYEMGIVEPDEVSDLVFENVYYIWFSMKSEKIKKQSLDRIECTYRRYYENSVLNATLVAKIDERFVIDWLTNILIRCGSVTRKEFFRIYQIVKNTMVYARDMDIKGVRLLDWDKILRYMPSNRIVAISHNDCCISRHDVDILFHAVLVDDVYSIKRSACLCLLLNFYLGLRVGELAALTWNDVDFQRRFINVSKTEVKYFERDSELKRVAHMTYVCEDGTKTLAGVRCVPLCNEAIYLLEQLRVYHEKMGYNDQHLAYDGEQTVLVRSLDRTMRKLCLLCKIPVYNTHKIRKTCASYLHDSRIPIKTISELLGHTDITTTSKYYIRNSLSDSEMLFRINEVFDNLVDLKEIK